MKATKEEILKAAELGMLRSMPDFLVQPLKPGRLKRLFLEISMILDGELRKIFKYNPEFFNDNKEDLAIYLEKFGKLTNWGQDKEGVHIASVVSFCLAFLENSSSKYSPKLIEHLVDILDYYERAGNLTYHDLWTGEQFKKEWDKLYG